MESIISVLDKIIGLDLGQALMVIVFILALVGKVVPNSKVVPIVSKIQVMMDLAAKLISKLGVVLQKGADFLAQVVQSDGLLGRK